MVRQTQFHRRQIQYIARRRRAGESLREIAKHFGVSHTTIRYHLMKESCQAILRRTLHLASY